MEAQESLPERKVAQLTVRATVLEQVVQRGCGNSMFGDSQKAHGVVLEIPVQLIMFEQGVGLDELQRSLSNSVIL